MTDSPPGPPTTAVPEGAVRSVMPAALVATDLFWETPDGRVLLDGVSLSLHRERVGLVGRNGMGKSTLLRILVGEILPQRGRVDRRGRIAYLPQGHRVRATSSVAAALGVEERLRAIERIESGEYHEALHKIVGDDWEVEARARRLLGRLGLASIAFERTMGTLSGGETARVVLAGLMLDEPDLLVLDEPTNHLDEPTRESLYDACRNWKNGLLVVSHDRTLLDLVDAILELSPLGLRRYGGNYGFYARQKQSEEEAAARELAGAREGLLRARREAQAQTERQRKKNARGRTARLKKPGSQSRAVLAAWKESSERTSGHVSEVQDRKIQDAGARVDESRRRVAEADALKIDLALTEIPAGKRVFELAGVSFAYPGGGFKLRDIDLAMVGPERVALRGPNGSGKSTLVRLILGDLAPCTGTARLGVARYAHLDQDATVLAPEATVLANLLDRNPGMEESHARIVLARYLFPAAEAFKRARDLSGGERIRAALACLLSAAEPPQLLVLDEPTNNLDLDSVTKVTRALAGYRGALLAISHDLRFLADIRVGRHVLLDGNGGIADRVSSPVGV